MPHEVGGEPGDFDALREAVDGAVEPPGPLEWDWVLRAVWFGVDHDPDAPAPRDVVDRAPPRRPDDDEPD